MRPLILWIVILSLLAGGCKYIKKQKMFSKSLDTIENSELSKDTAAEDSMALLSAAEQENNIFDEPPVVEPPVAESDFTPDGRYFMIVGSFQSQSNAEKYASKLEGMGYSASIIPSDIGYYRVSAQSYTTLQSGLNDIPNFRSAVTPGAWVHVKKR